MLAVNLGAIVMPTTPQFMCGPLALNGEAMSLTPAQLMERLAEYPELEELLLASYAFIGLPTSNDMVDATGFDTDRVKSLTKQLTSLGLVEPEQSLSSEIALTNDGRNLALDITNSYRDGIRRDEAIRRGVLQAIKEKGSASSEKLSEKWPGKELDRHPTHQEIYWAFKFLEEEGLIEATYAWGGAVVRSRTTTAGRDALGRNRRLVTPQSSNSVYDHSDRSQTINQQGANIGSFAVGNNNTFSGSVTVQEDSLEQIREEIASALSQVSQLPSAHQQVVREALEDVDSVAGSESPRSNVLRILLEKASAAAATAVGSTAGQTIGNSISAAMSLL